MKVEGYIALVTKRMYMYVFTLGFPIEPIDDPFYFHDTLQGGTCSNSCSERINTFVFRKKISGYYSRKCSCAGINQREQ